MATNIFSQDSRRQLFILVFLLFPPLEEIEIFGAKENIVQCDIRPERCGQSDAAEWKWNKIWGWVKHSLSLSGAPFNLLWDDLAHLLVWPETIAHAVKRKKSFRAFPFALKTLFTSSFGARFEQSLKKLEATTEISFLSQLLAPPLPPHSIQTGSSDETQRGTVCHDKEWKHCLYDLFSWCYDIWLESRSEKMKLWKTFNHLHNKLLTISRAGP